MSLGINATMAEGMILAADSRQSYRNLKGMARIGSDSASKIFQLNDKVGVIVAGLAFLPEKNQPKNISKYIEEFKLSSNSELDGLDVPELTEKLLIFFRTKYNSYLETVEEGIKNDLSAKGFSDIKFSKSKNEIKFLYNDNGLHKEGKIITDIIELLIAGYNKDRSHVVKTIVIPLEIDRVLRDSKKKNLEFGANWIGQKDVVSRIVVGFDPRVENIPFVKAAIQKLGSEEISKQLNSLQYAIQWGTMTLQDAIDFCKLAIETTSAIQRFSDGITGDPGDMPGVGGPVDIAVITPKKGFVWVSKKNLKIGDKEIDLDDFEDIKILKEKEKNGK